MKNFKYRLKTYICTKETDFDSLLPGWMFDSAYYLTAHRIGRKTRAQVEKHGIAYLHIVIPENSKLVIPGAFISDGVSKVYDWEARFNIGHDLKVRHAINDFQNINQQQRRSTS